MALSFSNRNGGGVLDSIKSKLGLGGQDDYDDQYDDEYDEYAQDYDDYEEEPMQGDDDFDRYDGVTTRSAGTNRSRRSSYTDRAGSSVSDRRSPTYPPLVNIEDVKNNTRVPDSLNRDPLPPRRRSSSSRASVGRASDYQLSGAEIERGLGDSPNTGAAPRDSRRSGYNSLFDPSPTSAEIDDPKPASSVGQGTHPASRGYDPYRAYEGTGSTSHAPSRQVTVLTPTDYSEVEGVARSLKSGDAVVLSLRRTGNQLSKRVLDFSFGVASALDANVDCIADQVFAITRSKPLTDEEIKNLRIKGVM